MSTVSNRVIRHSKLGCFLALLICGSIGACSGTATDCPESLHESTPEGKAADEASEDETSGVSTSDGTDPDGPDSDPMEEPDHVDEPDSTDEPDPTDEPAAGPDYCPAELPDPPGDTIVDLGEKGLKEGELIDPYLADWVVEGNEVHIPAGTYRWNGESGTDHANSSIVGDGEVFFDTGGGHNWSTNFNADGGDFEIRNITVKGVGGPEWKRIALWADAGHTVTARNFNQPDGAVEGDRIGFYVPKQHAGEAYFIDCHVGSFPNNGLYASGPGQLEPEAGDGPVHVIRGLYHNSNIANILVGSSGSTVIGAVSLQDEPAPPTGRGGRNQRGIWVRDDGDGLLIEDVDVYHTIDRNMAFAIQPRDESGSGTIKNVRIHNGSDTEALRLLDGDWTATGVDITGSGNLETDGGPIDDVCIGAGCEVASNMQLEICL